MMLAQGLKVDVEVTVLGVFRNDAVRRPAIHQGFYRTIDNGFGEWHSTDIGALFFL